MAQEKFTFQAEVSKLLDIVAHSLYSHREIFLRELVSNASDACDKLRYEALTKPDLIEGDGDFEIRLSFDAEAKTLTIADNGIGMSHDELVENLGTIAKSGTQAFVNNLTGDDKKDVSLIGQFGVGFYSSFMVADKVEALSRRAGDDKAYRWISDGKGEFTLAEEERETRGTTITLHLKEDASEYLEDQRIRHVVKTYSDHVAIPIKMMGAPSEEGEIADETLNTASALWTRSKSEITEEQYKEFYHHVAHAFDDPWMTLHNSVEGVLSYINLLFIPSMPPMDLFHPDRKQHVKLYVNRVFITDEAEELLPGYLRFVKGVVDSEDLSLNISREMLQKDPRLAKIRSGLTKKVLNELAKKADKEPEEYAKFWKTFGPVLKEGLYEDFGNREKLLEITRFATTAGEDLVSLKAYVERMKEGQEAIYYISGEEIEALRNSPQLEGFKAKGIEVLLLSDPVDEFWVSTIGKYEEKDLKSVTRGGADLSKVADTEKTEDGEKKDETPKVEGESLDKLVAAFKLSLGERVKDVRSTDRLTDSAVCLVAGDDDMDMHMERMLKKHKQFGVGGETPRILEINPKHPLIVKLADKAGAGESMDDPAHLLLDQARIVEGEAVADPVAFAKRLANVMERGLAG